MRFTKPTAIVALAALVAAGLTTSAVADPGGKGRGNSHDWKHHDDHDRGGYDGNRGRGFGVGEIPPGHQYRHHEHYYRRGDRLPDRYIVIVEPDRWGLPRLPRDQVYVRVDNQVLRTARDGAIVLEALDIVSRALQ
ncbi:MAG: hypothetical protein KDA73_09610 [Rhodobacteraceae bacterium]|nr:hypothetical protein [Paracoccaceae bacterium]